MQYVRNLEQRVKQLEEDKRSLTHKINQIATTTGDPSLAVPPDPPVGGLSGRPEAVVRALQVRFHINCFFLHCATMQIKRSYLDITKINMTDDFFLPRFLK